MWRPKFWFSWCKPFRHASIHSPHYPAEQEEGATAARKARPKLLQMTLRRREIHKRKSVTRNAPRVCFVVGEIELYIHGCCQISTSEGSLSRSLANLRRLRLHLRTVRAGDTRSVLLQPMGRMEATDSRPRNALIHRESGSTPDYLHTPGSRVSTRAHISSVQAASRVRRGDFALCAHRVREPTLRYTRAEALLEEGVLGSRQKSGSGPVGSERQDAPSGAGAGIRPAQDRSDGQRAPRLQAQPPFTFP